MVNLALMQQAAALAAEKVREAIGEEVREAVREEPGRAKGARRSTAGKEESPADLMERRRPAPGSEEVANLAARVYAREQVRAWRLSQEKERSILEILEEREAYCQSD